MNEYESIQRGTVDAMASQSPGNPRTHEGPPEASGPHFGADPRVLARMPDLSASEPEVTNTPSRRRRRNPDGVLPGSAASPKVVMFAVAAVVVVIFTAFYVFRPGDSDTEQASQEEPQDFDTLDATIPDDPLLSETADAGGQYPWATDPYSGTDPSQSTTWDDQRYPNEWSQARGQAYGDPGPPAPWTNPENFVADQTLPPSQYNGPQAGGYEARSAATNAWDGTPLQRPGAAPAVPEPYYGRQSAPDRTPYSGQYELARPPAPYQDSTTTYRDTYQRTQTNPYVHPQTVPYTRSNPPSAAVTIAPPTSNLRDRQQLYAPNRTDPGIYGATGSGVPAVAQRPTYGADVRPPSTNTTPYRTDRSLPPEYRTPTTQPPAYSPSYRQGTPQTSYPNTNSAFGAGSLAPRYSDGSTYQYSQPGQPGVATLDGVIERQPPARASYDSSRPSLY